MYCVAAKLTATSREDRRRLLASRNCRGIQGVAASGRTQIASPLLVSCALIEVVHSSAIARLRTFTELATVPLEAEYVTETFCPTLGRASRRFSECAWQTELKGAVPGDLRFRQ